MMDTSTKSRLEHIERVTFAMPRTLADEIDRFWHRERLGSRSEAIRLLIEAGLEKRAARKREEKT